MKHRYGYQWLREHAESHPEAPFIGTPSGWLDYGSMASRVYALAGSLAEAGLGRGDVLLTALPNGPGCVAMTLAAHSLGAVVAELNPETSKEMIHSIVQQTSTRFAAFSGRASKLFTGLSLSHVWVQHPQEPPAALRQAVGVELTWLKDDGTIDPGFEREGSGPSSDTDVGLLVYTSGSTGLPRAVAQTHKNLFANNSDIARYLSLTASDRACQILPLFYCYGRSILWSHLFVGGSVFFDHRFMYPRVVLEAIGQEQCTGFAGVPLTFELLKRQVDVASIPMRSLRYVTQAGGGMRPETIDWVRQAFAPAELFVMYGQTEATARLTYLAPKYAISKRGSVGRPVDAIRLTIKDDEGRVLLPNEIGNVVAAGDSIMQGYYKDAQGTAEVLRAGELWTGDQGYLDTDGFLFLKGRSKEIMKLGGHRVSATEIEEVIASIPGVKEVAVVGESDDVEGEVAVAYAVADTGVELQENEIKRSIRNRLPAFKVPREILFVESLPRTATGKVARAMLHQLRKVTG